MAGCYSVIKAASPAFLVVALALNDPSARALATGQAGGPASAIDLTAIDGTCSPCEDFYQYANGAWIARTTIPTNRASVGTLSELRDEVQNVLNEIIGASAEDVRAGRARQGSNAYKIGAQYAACVDTAQIEKLGISPVADTFRNISGIGDRAGLLRVMGQLQRSMSVGPIAAGLAPEQTNASRYLTVFAFLGGLGLPSREYYVDNSERYIGIRAAYRDHVQRMFGLIGERNAPTAADAVVALETALATLQPDLTTARDPRNTYNKVTLAQLAALTPAIPWDAFLSGLDAPALSEVNARYPKALLGLDGLMSSVPLDEWKMLLRWLVVKTMASSLPEVFAAEDFAFNARLTGVEVRQSRDVVCAEETSRVMGDVLAQAFVEKRFSPKARQHARDMTSRILSVLRQRLVTVGWMQEPTRNAALAKVDAMLLKVGYPDEFRRHQDLTALPTEYLGNRIRTRLAAHKRDWARLGQTVNRDDWRGPPSQPRAFYGPPYNDIHVFAALLQPPVFDLRADDAQNYGAAGAIIGHELSHAFDITGRRFDASGTARDWWTAADSERYTRIADKIEQQYGQYAISPDQRVNGRATLGENIADLVGLQIAYAAMQLAGQNGGLKDDFTREQRFFLAYARMFRVVERPEAALGARSGSHAPFKWRVNGPLANMTEFAKAFGCKEGDAMVLAPDARASFWAH